MDWSVEVVAATADSVSDEQASALRDALQDPEGSVSVGPGSCFEAHVLVEAPNARRAIDRGLASVAWATKMTDVHVTRILRLAATEAGGSGRCR